MRSTIALLTLALLVAAGCGDAYDQPLSSPRRTADPGAFGVVVDPFETQSAPAAKGETAKPEKAVDSPASDDKEGAEKQPAEAAKAPAQPPVREEAKVGVGKKGSGYGGGFVTTPVSVYFRAQERIIFENQVPHALNLYKATNGRAPQTHEEFMEKIIKANMISLPELPGGYRYLYDPQKEQLMVEHPAR